MVAAADRSPSLSAAARTAVVQSWFSIVRGVSVAALVALIAIAAGCGDDSSSDVAPTATATPTPVPFVKYGIAVVGDDGTGFSHGLQVIQVEDSKGKAEPTPQATFVPIPQLIDIDGLSFTPDAKHGAIVDGTNLVYFFSSDIKKGTITILPSTIDVAQFGGDGDSIASLPGGDEVLVSAGGQTDHALISGVLSGKPKLAEAIATSGMAAEFDGVVTSDRGGVMLSRAGFYGVLDVYRITPVTPHPGPLGGTVAFDFKLTKTLTSIADYCCDGRGGMAISPTDQSRAVLVGSDGSVTLLTGLPDKPAVAHTLTLSAAAGSVAITPDGKFALVGQAGGIAVLSGVESGTLTQVGSLYSPTFSTPAGNCQLLEPYTLGVMSDGKYVVTIQNCGLTQSATEVGAGVLLTIPFSAGVLEQPVGQLNYVVTPFSDQLLVH
jgi:hypothetical protein